MPFTFIVYFNPHSMKQHDYYCHHPPFTGGETKAWKEYLLYPSTLSQSVLETRLKPKLAHSRAQVDPSRPKQSFSPSMDLSTSHVLSSVSSEITAFIIHPLL